MVGQSGFFQVADTSEFRKPIDHTLPTKDVACRVCASASSSFCVGHDARMFPGTPEYSLESQNQSTYCHCKAIVFICFTVILSIHALAQVQYL